MVTINRTENARRCQNYLAGLIGDFGRECLVIFPDEKRVDTNDPSFFNRLARRVGEVGLLNLRGRLVFPLHIPLTIGSGSYAEQWDVTLPGDKTRSFLDKYGAQYHVQEI